MNILRPTGMALMAMGLARADVPMPDYRLDVPVPAGELAPQVYRAQKSAQPVVVDGKADDGVWQTAEWTADYIDIEGESKPKPWHRTRCKMAWDDRYFYVFAEMDEPHLWATLTKRDSIIFYDNDFEVFIDPDRDNHQYAELEVNALNTVWDLALVKPYRDGGPAVHGWDIAGLKTAVALDGTLNDPSDEDRGWSVEIAIPHHALKELAKGNFPPLPGDRWKVNFSRVQWSLEPDATNPHGYRKQTDAKTGKPKSEHNWVWSPQGIVNMHYPERWGVVEFADGSADELVQITEDERVVDVLMAHYYQARAAQVPGVKPKPLDLELPQGWTLRPMKRFGFGFVIAAEKDGQIIAVDHQGRISRGPQSPKK
ncbi:carbohydrate-binding family 9-like protein [Sulfuriroseicoccus oceanibius]|uniref:Carbohydrate-binding family 9-like protein n=1 Tax=Sulfuriroseicoccus oceanibius TaxID=2707525 RepID=A0A7T7F2H0_9BACT|nr:carbohydrate-binding family 9-like protein [Sulfuriroseicoccus oceanibius]QQL45424.1 carbohydrate-binding family 9-like protein [Sulfuriroseicoccus oceanibius]